MNTATVATTACLLLVPACASPGNDPGNCYRKEVEAHVQQQFAQYGPLSIEHEYFGFIYRHEGRIESAVTRSGMCRRGNCLVDTARAFVLIPPGSKVFGEWHTHPHDGSVQLSIEDVRGARHNRHIRCYAAYYSEPNGEIFSWDAASTSVPVAMASRAAIGSYAEQRVAKGDNEKESQPDL